MSLAETAAIVKSCILSRKENTTIDALKDDYHEQMGEPIPFKKLGFSSLANLLEALPGIVVQNDHYGQTVVKAESAKAAHIGKMVDRQRQVPKKSKKKKQAWNVPMAHKRYPADLGILNKNYKFMRLQLLGYYKNYFQSGGVVGANHPTGGQSRSSESGKSSPLLLGSGTGFTKGSEYHTPKKAAPQKVAPQKAAPQKAAPQKAAPQKSCPPLKDHFPKTSYKPQLSAKSFPSSSNYSDSQPSSGKGYLPAGEEIVLSSDDDWCTDDEFSPPPVPRLQSEIANRPSGDLRLKLTQMRDQDLRRLQGPFLDFPTASRSVSTVTSSDTSSVISSVTSSIGSSAAYRLIPHRSFKRPPYEPNTKAGRERAMRNSPNCIFSQIVRQQRAGVYRTVEYAGDNVLVTVKNDAMGDEHSASFNSSFFENFENGDCSLVEAVLDSLPDRWEPAPCTWDYYFLGDDFLIEFVAEEMICDYNETELRSSCLCFSGFTISDGYELMKTLDWVPPRICVMLGFIDILRGHALENMKKDMKNLVKFLAKRTDQVAVCSLPFFASADGCNAQVLRFNMFLSSLASKRVTVIDCHTVFTDSEGCIDETYYEQKPTHLYNSSKPVHLWNVAGRATFYHFIFKELRKLYLKSIPSF